MTSPFEKTAIAFGTVALALCGTFFFIIASALMGALAGWIVGLFFSDTILGILAQLGIRNIGMWQFGAFMGFVGGFLKTKVSVQERK